MDPLHQETVIEAGKVVLIAHVSLEEIIRAKEIINRTKPKRSVHPQSVYQLRESSK